jgi:hypothetical protein
MTDPTPNDLSHLIDEAFEALCPQGEHAPVPTPLSPAQVIVKAFDDRYELLGPLEDDWQEQCIAAALCAAAKQIAPTKQNYSEASDLLAATCFNGMAYAANELRLIATELENHQ